jgi:TM2 domain-containing membrane protein YozV
MDELAIQRSMSLDERMLFQNEMNQRRKNATTAVLITLFLGGVGGQRYYMGQIGLGVASSLFCWTFIPLAVSLVELFTISGTVHRYNVRQANIVAARVRGLPDPVERMTSEEAALDGHRLKGLMMVAAVVGLVILISRLFFGPSVPAPDPASTGAPAWCAETGGAWNGTTCVVRGASRKQ